MTQYNQEYDSAKKKRDTIDDCIQKSNTFCLDASDKIKNDIKDEMKAMSGDILDFYADVHIIVANPANTNRNKS